MFSLVMQPRTVLSPKTQIERCEICMCSRLVLSSTCTSIDSTGKKNFSDLKIFKVWKWGIWLVALGNVFRSHFRISCTIAWKLTGRVVLGHTIREPKTESKYLDTFRSYEQLTATMTALHRHKSRSARTRISQEPLSSHTSTFARVLGLLSSSTCMSVDSIQNTIFFSFSDL